MTAAPRAPIQQTPLFEIVTPTPKPQKRKYVRFLRTITDAAGDLIGLADKSVKAFTASRHYDAQADARVEMIDRLAYRIAVEADARGEESLLLLAGRIRRECAGYRQDDAHETRFWEAGAAVLHGIVKTARALNVAITERLTLLSSGGGK